MAGGIDWFRWHHGTVTDQKFPLVARRAGASVAEVIAVWACLLERASMNEQERGWLGAAPDFESMDCALGLEDGKAQAIFVALQQRDLIDEGLHVTAWPARQPKRERPDDSSTERSRAHRERQRHATPEVGDATPCNATERQETPREEESREDISKTTSSHPPGGGKAARFDDFWLSWPKSERKQDKAKCVAHWKLHSLDAQADAILADVRTKRGTVKWHDGFIEAPLVYLRGKRWEDGVTPDDRRPDPRAPPTPEQSAADGNRAALATRQMLDAQAAVQVASRETIAKAKEQLERLKRAQRQPETDTAGEAT